MRRPFIAANWKMHKTAQEAVAYAEHFLPLVGQLREATTDIVLAPPFLALPALAQALSRGPGSTSPPIGVAAQNVSAEPHGAFTGEISLDMLTAAGATSVILGHSERRQLFGETDAGVRAKTRATLAAGLTPIVCIGETLDDRETNRTLDVLTRQVEQGLDGRSREEIGTLVMAYEPVWAIGTGRVATPEQANAAHRHVRGKLKEQFGTDGAAACRIIYGGSVKPDSIAALMAQPEVDGALVGGASLDPVSFAKIVALSHETA